MKKEVLIAIFAGFALGLIITIGISNAQKSLQKKEQQTSEKTSPTPPTEPTHLVTVNTPIDTAVVADSPAIISGTTTPLAVISVISPFDATTTIADDTGHFSTQLELEAGANLISIKSYTEAGEMAQTDMSLVHSTADLTLDNTNQEDTDE